MLAGAVTAAALYLHTGAGWPLLAAALLVAVTGLGFAWSALRCDDGARE